MNVLHNIVLRRLIICIIRILIPIHVFIILLHYESALHCVQALSSWCRYTTLLYHTCVKVLLVLSINLIAHDNMLTIFILYTLRRGSIYILLWWLSYVSSLRLYCWYLSSSACNKNSSSALISNLWHVEFDVIHLLFVHCRVSITSDRFYILERLVLIWCLNSAVILSGNWRASSQV